MLKTHTVQGISYKYCNTLYLRNGYLINRKKPPFLPIHICGVSRQELMSLAFPFTPTFTTKRWLVERSAPTCCSEQPTFFGFLVQNNRPPGFCPNFNQVNPCSFITRPAAESHDLFLLFTFE